MGIIFPPAPWLDFNQVQLVVPGREQEARRHLRSGPDFDEAGGGPAQAAGQHWLPQQRVHHAGLATAGAAKQADLNVGAVGHLAENTQLLASGRQAA